HPGIAGLLRAIDRLSEGKDGGAARAPAAEDARTPSRRLRIAPAWLALPVAIALLLVGVVAWQRQTKGGDRSPDAEPQRPVAASPAAGSSVAAGSAEREPDREPAAPQGERITLLAPENGGHVVAASSD